jgi:hypothetical protein
MKKYLLIFAILLTGCQTEQLPQEELTVLNAEVRTDAPVLWKDGKVPFIMNARGKNSLKTTALLYQAMERIESKTDIEFIETTENRGSLKLVEFITFDKEKGSVCEFGFQAEDTNGQYLGVNLNADLQYTLRVFAYTLGQESAAREKIDYEYLNTIY